MCDEAETCAGGALAVRSRSFPVAAGFSRRDIGTTTYTPNDDVLCASLKIRRQDLQALR